MSISPSLFSTIFLLELLSTLVMMSLIDLYSHRFLILLNHSGYHFYFPRRLFVNFVLFLFGGVSIHASFISLRFLLAVTL